jgi:endonuclease/exonuclease/phosphatase family metal-dependent hydrolase
MNRDPALLRASERLRHAIAPYRTLAALHASRDWPEIEALATQVLGQPRFAEPERPPAPLDPTAPVRAVHWNIEHGNWYDQVESALTRHPKLKGADLLFFNEIDLGMARAGNRDVAADLARALCRHAVWAPLFVETTLGRDDDASTAEDRVNQESLFGIAILSRWPIGEVRIVDLPSPWRIQFESERMFGRHAALIAAIERPGDPFVAVSVHLEVHRTRADRAAQMDATLAALDGETRPVILAGDFNSHTFDRGGPLGPLSGAAALLLSSSTALERRLLFPDRGPHAEPLFPSLARAGFAWEPYTDRAPTLQLRLDRLEETQQLFGPLAGAARRALAWAEQRGRLRLDWFAGRGWTNAAARPGEHGDTVPGLDGPGRASDHAPLVARFW